MLDILELLKLLSKNTQQAYLKTNKEQYSINCNTITLKIS